MNFLRTHGWKHVATMLLGLCLTGTQMACLLPQDDQLIAPVPPPANRPLRVLPGLAVPGQRETTLTFGANCTPPGFSVKVDDPNVEDKIAALWFIDPIERYIGGVPGNAGTAVSSGSTVREVKAPSQFMTTLRAYTDGRKHRVEVVMTDGDFIENQRNDPDGTPQPFLDITKAAFRTGTGDAGVVINVPAYRDDFVWLVDIDTGPCQ
jgi:hypothetical protein